jgi:hypothetical protein
MKPKSPQQVLWDCGLAFETVEMMESIVRAMKIYHRQFKPWKRIINLFKS